MQLWYWNQNLPVLIIKGEEDRCYGSKTEKESGCDQLAAFGEHRVKKNLDGEI